MTNLEMLKQINDPAEFSRILNYGKCRRCSNYYREKNRPDYCHSTINESDCETGIKEWLESEPEHNLQAKYNKQYNHFASTKDGVLYHQEHYPEGRVPIDHATREKYNQLMRGKTVDYAKHDIKKYDTVESWTVTFPDINNKIYEVDLKVCSSDTDTPLWFEAVLFENGWEINHTDVYSTIPNHIEIKDPDNDRTFIIKTY